MGVLAHVDAGKTSLTERLLYAVGVRDEIGRVVSGVEGVQAQTRVLLRALCTGGRCRTAS